MQVPLTVSFDGIPVDESIRAVCWSEAEKLERYYDRITSCHVTVTQPKRHRNGNPYDVHLRLAVPGRDIVVSRSSPEHRADEKAKLAVHEAFDEARRQLQDHAQRQRGDVKHRAAD